MKPDLAHAAVVGVAQHEGLSVDGEVLVQCAVSCVAWVVHWYVLHDGVSKIRLHDVTPFVTQCHAKVVSGNIPK